MSPRAAWTSTGGSREIPKAAAVFAGVWIDSLGNSVHVEVADDTPTVTLIKRFGGRPLELSLFYDERWQNWKCGNGFLDELVYKDSPEIGRVLNLISWTTKDGRVSTWIRAPTEPACVQNKDPEPTAVATPPVEAVPDRQPLPDQELLPEAERLPHLMNAGTSPIREYSAKGRQSWFEITEEWDDSFGQTEFIQGSKPAVQGQNNGDKVADGERKRSKRGRRGGRNRSGRNTQPAS